MATLHHGLSKAKWEEGVIVIVVTFHHSRYTTNRTTAQTDEGGYMNEYMVVE